MYKINDSRFIELTKSGLFNFRNGHWYRKTVRIKWERYITLKCLQCGEEFITRHEDKCCSKSCGRKYYWKTLPIVKRFRIMETTNQHGYHFIRNSKNELVAEHRHVMQIILGRRLKTSEHVHHINGNRKDNRPQNLMVLSASGHNVIHKPDQSKEWKRDTIGKFVKKHR